VSVPAGNDLAGGLAGDEPGLDRSLDELVGVGGGSPRRIGVREREVDGHRVSAVRPLDVSRLVEPGIPERLPRRGESQVDRAAEPSDAARASAGAAT
jgi:hypothetical protein